MIHILKEQLQNIGRKKKLHVMCRPEEISFKITDKNVVLTIALGKQNN